MRDETRRLIEVQLVTIVGVAFLIFGVRADELPPGYRNSGAGTTVCEPITHVPICQDAPYNLTSFPNVVGHVDQAQAAEALLHYESLISRGYTCHPNLKFFLCSVFTPMCAQNIDGGVSVTSCQSVCEDVRRRCLPMLQRVGLPWPEVLNCSRFPKAGELCMDPGSDAIAAGSAPVHIPPAIVDREPVGQQSPHDSSLIENFLDESGGDSSLTTRARAGSNPRCAHDYFTLSTSVSARECVQSCHREVMFRQSDRSFAQLWMTIWAPLCLIVCVFVVLTFLLDKTRFEWPVRPVIFISLCYAFYSLGYIARLLVRSAEHVACVADAKSGCRYLVEGGLEPTCVLVFILLYYFSTAAALWFLAMTVGFFLASRRSVATEVISRWSSAFHVVAWVVPAVLTVTALITNRAHGDELTGLCFVGGGADSLLFVVVPQVACLLFGACFVLVGFLAASRISKELRSQEGGGALLTASSTASTTPRLGVRNVGNMETLLVKLRAFCVLYMVPQVCVIGCLVYEHVLDHYWQPHKQAYCNATLAGTPLRRAGDSSFVLPPQPRVEIFMLKIFMSLFVGTTGGMWMFSRKTWQTWTRFLECRRLWPPQATLKLPPASVNSQTVKLLASPQPQPQKSMISSGLSSSASRHQQRYGGAGAAFSRPLQPSPAAALTISQASSYNGRGTGGSYYNRRTPLPHYPSGASSGEMSKV